MPLTVLWQPHGPLEWIHLPLHSLHVIHSLPSMLAQLITRGRTRSLQLLGKEPDFLICAMLTKEKFENLQQFDLNWQIALASYPGQVKFHLPADELLQFLNKVSTIPQGPLSHSPVEEAANIFVDANKSGNIAIYYVSNNEKHIKNYHYSTKSVQRAELKAVAIALQKYPEPLNLFTVYMLLKLCPYFPLPFYVVMMKSYISSSRLFNTVFLKDII